MKLLFENWRKYLNESGLGPVDLKLGSNLTNRPPPRTASQEELDRLANNIVIMMGLLKPEEEYTKENFINLPFGKLFNQERQLRSFVLKNIVGRRDMLDGFLKDKGVLNEATEYDEHFTRILDSDTPAQAVELAASLNIPLRDLPWNLERIKNYIRARIADWSAEQIREQGVLPVRDEIMKEIGISQDEYWEMYREYHRTYRPPSEENWTL